jgi:subfamily B ATP-binding cassette protein MsbA
MSELRPLLFYALPHRFLLAVGIALMTLESATALAVPWLGGKLATLVLDAGDTGIWSAPGVLGALLALFGVQGLLKFGNTYLLGSVGEEIVADLKIQIYDHLQALPLSFFQQRRQGDTLALLTRDVYVLSGYISGTAIAIVPLVFTVAGSVFFMFRLAPKLALLAAFLIPLFFLLLKIFSRRVRPLATQLSEEHATAIAIAEENLGMMPAIKTFTREPQESARHRGQVDRVRALTARQLKIEAALGPAIQFIAAVGIVLILWLASAGVGGGKLTPGELVSFLLYAQLLTRPVAGLAHVYGQTQLARAALKRILAALDQTPEPPAHVGVPLPPVKGAIEFNQISFGYPGRAAALQHVNLSITAGETLAIIGPNGAGKSTLAHLLMRLHEPTEGRIRIDGIDIATVSLESLRRQIGVVPQHVLLFNASVRDNIAYGRSEPTLEQIEAATRAARAHDFVMQLPDSYQTLIGDRGVRLSGGQQQRIALARALLKDPPILLLDEATAMFDPQGEMEFLEECRESFSRRTVLLITHRPASLAVADRIVRMEAGRIVAIEDLTNARTAIA